VSFSANLRTAASQELENDDVSVSDELRRVSVCVHARAVGA
jgi:hypothetical protein